MSRQLAGLCVAALVGCSLAATTPQTRAVYPPIMGNVTLPMDTKGLDFNFKWSLDIEKREMTANYTVKSPKEMDLTQKWFAVGLSDSQGGMPGSDIWMIMFNDGWTVTDMFTTESATPTRDLKQDTKLVSHKNENDVNGMNRVEVIFTRRFESCDEEDWPIKHGGSWIIYASGPMMKGTPMQHSDDKGSTLIYFYPDEKPKKATTPENMQTKRIASPPFHIPATETNYICSKHTLPSDQPYHLTAGEFIDDVKYTKEYKKKENLVHHIIIYGCTKDSTEIPDNTAVDCEKAKRRDCNNFLYGWVPGTDGMNMPADVGQKIGKCPGCFQFAMMEIHYNNPDLKEGVIDSSGITLLYTAQLRQHSATVISFGGPTSPDAISIPPHSVRSSIYPCLGKATKDHIPTEGMTTVAVFNHMHLTGRNFSTRVVRDGQVVHEFAKQDYYRFSHQNYQFLDRKNSKIMPGDDIHVRCDWDNRYGKSKDKLVVGGPATSDEMCIAFLLVYPIPDLTHCMGMPLEPDSMVKTGAAWTDPKTGKEDFKMIEVSPEEAKYTYDHMSGVDGGGCGIKPMPPTIPNDPAWQHTKFNDGMLDTVTKMRKDKGMKPLTSDRALFKKAQEAADMCLSAGEQGMPFQMAKLCEMHTNNPSESLSEPVFNFLDAKIPQGQAWKDQATVGVACAISTKDCSGTCGPYSEYRTLVCSWDSPTPAATTNEAIPAFYDHMLTANQDGPKKASHDMKGMHGSLPYIGAGLMVVAAMVVAGVTIRHRRRAEYQEVDQASFSSVSDDGFEEGL